ncbi:lecithin retinol acyltransferase family protein [Clostridium thailandense]|uniref:lecithin retinol acyltransferase family protein n=1 Tax=Clostridium thailandense TaxID=2794346 RepID=UPI0039891ED4
MLKKSCLSLALLIAMGVTFVLPDTVSAFNAPTNQVVNSKKLWTIKFTKEFTMDDITKEGISVKDSEDKPIEVTFDIGQDKKTLLINPPLGGYTSGEKYTLSLSQDVHSVNEKLPKAIDMSFTINSDTLPKYTVVNRDAIPGDIVGIAGNFQGYSYCHYGIYIGNNKVIHYSSTDGTMKSAEICIGDMDARFPKGQYFVLDFGTNAKFSAEDTIKRAQSRLGEKSYDLINNNCEHFAVWCKTDNAESYQIDALNQTEIQLLKQFTATGMIPD